MNVKDYLKKKKDPQGYAERRSLEIFHTLENLFTTTLPKVQDAVTTLFTLMSKKKDEFLTGVDDLTNLVNEKKSAIEDVSLFTESVKKEAEETLTVLKNKATEVQKIDTQVSASLSELKRMKPREITHEIIREQPVVTEVVREVAIPETVDVLVKKLNTTKESVDMSVIKGLLQEIELLKTEIRKKSSKGGGGGGMGNIVTQSTPITSATTTITLDSRVASNGKAIWLNYQGQQQAYGTHFTVSGRIITLLFTPDDNTYADIIYIRA